MNVCLLNTKGKQSHKLVVKLNLVVTYLNVPTLVVTLNTVIMDLLNYIALTGKSTSALGCYSNNFGFM